MGRSNWVTDLAVEMHRAVSNVFRQEGNLELHSQEILSGELNPTSAFMTGKLSVDGDMGKAMALLTGGRAVRCVSTSDVCVSVCTRVFGCVYVCVCEFV